MSILVIINPVSGSQKAIKIFDKLKPILGTRVLHTIISTKPRHIYEIANTLDAKLYEKVVLVGGDGTFHEFVNGIMDRADGFRIPIGMIPAGTGNSLMHDLGALDPINAMRRILQGDTLKIDIAKVLFDEGHIYAFNVIGWGIPASVNQKAERLKILGGQRYNFAALIEIIRNPSFQLQLTIAGEEIEGEYCFFMACNTIHTGKGMKVAPRALLSDGKFDLVLLKRTSRLMLIKLFSKIFKGNHILSPLVDYRQASEFKLKVVTPSKLIIDGQVTGSTPLSVEILPKEIEVFT